MTKRLIPSMLAAGLAIGLAAPSAHADDTDRQLCLAVMALGVNPYDPSDSYTLNRLQRYPDMAYNQAQALVETAYNSVHYHQNPLCDNVTVPDNY